MSADPCVYPPTEEALLECRRQQYDGAENSIRNLVQALSKAYAEEPELLTAFTAAQAKWHVPGRRVQAKDV